MIYVNQEYGKQSHTLFSSFGDSWHKQNSRYKKLLWQMNYVSNPLKLTGCVCDRQGIKKGCHTFFWKLFYIHRKKLLFINYAQRCIIFLYIYLYYIKCDIVTNKRKYRYIHKKLVTLFVTLMSHFSILDGKSVTFLASSVTLSHFFSETLFLFMIF